MTFVYLLLGCSRGGSADTGAPCLQERTFDPAILADACTCWGGFTGVDDSRSVSMFVGCGESGDREIDARFHVSVSLGDYPEWTSCADDGPCAGMSWGHPVRTYDAVEGTLGCHPEDDGTLTLTLTDVVLRSDGCDDVDVAIWTTTVTDSKP